MHIQYRIFRAAFILAGSLVVLPYVVLTEDLITAFLSSFHVSAPVAWSPSTTILSQGLQLLCSSTQISSFTSIWTVELVSQNMLQPGAVDFDEGLTLRNGIGVMKTHRLEEGGCLRLGGVEPQMKSAQHSQRAAGLTVRGKEHLWSRCFLEQTDVQQGTYCVRCCR